MASIQPRALRSRRTLGQGAKAALHAPRFDAAVFDIAAEATELVIDVEVGK